MGMGMGMGIMLPIQKSSGVARSECAIRLRDA